MVGPIVDTLKDLAGRWLMRSARTAKDHPFDAPKHYAHHEDPHANARPTSAPQPAPEPGQSKPVNGDASAPLPAPTPPAPPSAEAAPATTADSAAMASDATSARKWCAEMRQALPAPEGAIGEAIVSVLRTCYDPEIPVNIYELGLIYSIEVDSEQNAWVVMTLTSPMCPVAGSLPPEVEGKVATVEGVKSAKVDVVWEPPWAPDMMTEAAKLELGML